LGALRRRGDEDSHKRKVERRGLIAPDGKHSPEKNHTGGEDIEGRGTEEKQGSPILLGGSRKEKNSEVNDCSPLP